jgi:hypothetical protein
MGMVPAFMNACHIGSCLKSNFTCGMGEADDLGASFDGW